MATAFKCRIQYNSDIPKIRKFFEDTDTLNIAAGKAGIAFFATTPNDTCYYIIEIHEYDTHRLLVNTDVSDVWKNGGIVRSFPAAPFTNFIKSKESNNDLQIEIDANGTELTLSIMRDANVIDHVDIHLIPPKIVHEYPIMTYANAVIKVNDFKKLCIDMSKASSEITILSQPEAVRMIAGSTKATYGTWDEKLPPSQVHECQVKNTAFLKATKINIGNTKNSQAGIYIQPDYPLMLKVKLGIIDFTIYSKKWVSTTSTVRERPEVQEDA